MSKVRRVVPHVLGFGAGVLVGALAGIVAGILVGVGIAKAAGVM